MEEDELGLTDAHFEAFCACTGGLLNKELGRSIYEQYGVHNGLDFEEGTATYFALHAEKGSITADDEFAQGPRAKAYTLALANRYPDQRN